MKVIVGVLLLLVVASAEINLRKNEDPVVQVQNLDAVQIMQDEGRVIMIKQDLNTQVGQPTDCCNWCVGACQANGYPYCLCATGTAGNCEATCSTGWSSTYCPYQGYVHCTLS